MTGSNEPLNMGEMLSGALVYGQGLAAEMPPIYHDTTPRDTERNTRRAADEAAEATAHMKVLTEAMAESVRLSAATRADAEKLAEETRNAGLHAMVIGYSSLGLAVASVVIAVIALVNGMA